MDSSARAFTEVRYQPGRVSMGQESIRRVLTIALLTLPLSFACKIEEDVLPTGTVGFTLGRGVVAWFRQPQWNQQVTFLGQKRRINGIRELPAFMQQRQAIMGEAALHARPGTCARGCYHFVDGLDQPRHSHGSRWDDDHRERHYVHDSKGLVPDCRRN